MIRVRRAAALLAGLVGITAVATSGATAGAQASEPCGDGAAFWGCSWDAGFVDGMAFEGDTISLSGSFRAPFTDEIGRVVALLTPRTERDDCPEAEAVQEYDDPSGPPDTTVPDDGMVHFSLTGIVPRCNDVYDVVVHAYRSVGETVDESPPLELDGVRVALRPPSPAGPLRVERPPSPTALVTVRWGSPAVWASTGPPPDFLGYRLERALGDSVFETIGTTGGSFLVDNQTASAGPGTYRYRVLALRRDSIAEHTANILNSSVADAPTAEIAIEAPPTTTTPPTDPTAPVVRSGGAGGSVTVGRSGGVPTGETVVPDSGFTETLDYSDFEFGTEEAVPPNDAERFLDLDEEDAPGAGLVEPLAIGSCLAVWALHLRYLSRRADELA